MQYDQVQFPNCRRFSFFKKKGTLIMKFYKCCSPDVRPQQISDCHDFNSIFSIRTKNFHQVVSNKMVI